ncbi:hypothetical protein BDN72DRAFT_883610 [Pluteus cervinus]|uniref:Uncharacterized protein n=1 Tax=Pluteus cervinus TaxID=181527 RepID=A0ACD3A6G8_9AGAR|nr:hypothetical protein BDN72DRAFT_883610 [Pluteus cervinus]
MSTFPEAQIEFKGLYDSHFEERSKIDREIIELERQLHMLRVKRNALLPILSIPTDILLEIFEIAKIKSEDGSVLPFRMVEITWVCDRWRQVALNHPVFWTEICHSLSAMWKKTFLQRSRPAHISIRMDDAYKGSELRDTFPLEAPRIRHLEVYNGCLAEELVSTTPAPVLRSVKLWGHRSCNRPLFSGVAPYLTTVDMIGCEAFRFPIIPFPQLTELHLTRINPKLSIHECLIGLSLFPNLRNLTFHVALTDHSTAGVRLPQVSLPNLQFISVDEYPVSISSISTFLCQILGHPNVVTTVYASGLVGQVPAYLLLLAHLRVFETPKALSLYISNNYFNLTAFKSNEENPVTSVKILFRALDGQCGHLMQILRQIPLSTLSSITFVDPSGSSFPFPRALWSDITSPLPNLQKLVLDNIFASSFISYVGSLDPFIILPTLRGQPFPPPSTSISGENDITRALPFPALRSLTLNSLTANAEVTHSFYKVLKARKESGVGLEEFTLTDWGLLTFDDAPLDRCADRVRVEKHARRPLPNYFRDYSGNIPTTSR